MGDRARRQGAARPRGPRGRRGGRIVSVEFPLHDDSATRLRPPEDGIVASARTGGWVAEAFNALLPDEPTAAAARVTRGRTFARGGRVRDLSLTPGLASAEVIVADVHRVSIHVRLLEAGEWSIVRDILLKDLSS